MVSIIVSFYERLQHLKTCLDALALCQNDFDEVIVTDDGSSEQTVTKLETMIRQYSFPISHVWHEKQGFQLAKARNNGIKQAKGDYLIFIDCDFLVLPDTIKNHNRKAKHNRFVVGGCKYLSEEQTKELFNARISENLIYEFDNQISNNDIIREHRKCIKRTILIRLKLRKPKTFSSGGHFSIYRRDIERVNGFDENFKGWGGEDIDMGIRLTTAGIYAVSGNKDIKILHMWHPKQLGSKHWKEGTNVEYLNRTDIPYRCEIGLDSH